MCGWLRVTRRACAWGGARRPWVRLSACPVVALSQLSRASESRNPPTPVLSDLRESGSIEQDADVVGFIYRPEYYNPKDESLMGLAELIVAKQRNGPTGTVKLAFIKEHTRFENLAR